MLNAVVQMAAVQLELCLTGAAAGTPAAPGFCAGKPGVSAAACSRENKYELSINNIEKALDFPPARV